MLAPTLAGAGLVNDLVNQVGATVDETAKGLLGQGDPAPAPQPAPSADPSPEAGVPPDYTPPAHGTNPHGQGAIGVVDLFPEDSEPLPYDPGGGSEDVVVGGARGEQVGGEYHGHITIAALLGNEILGVDTGEGETEAGPLDALQEGLLDAICDGSGDQVCLEVLRADSETDANGSRNSFAVATAQVGGPTGIGATAAESNGNISETSNCQRAHGDSTVANAAVGTALTADVIESESTSRACRNGDESTEQESRVVNLNDTGLPVPVAGCADGTPDSEFTPLLPLAAAVCNPDDTEGSQATDPYGVREGLALFAVVIGGPLAKLTTAPSESRAVAPRGGDECPDPNNPDCPPDCPDPTNPDCPDNECPDATNPDCPDNECPDSDPDCPDDDDGDDDGDACPDVPGPASNDGCPFGPSADSDGSLPFTGADMAALGMIGLGIMGTGLGLMAVADRRRRTTRV